MIALKLWQTKCQEGLQLLLAQRSHSSVNTAMQARSVHVNLISDSLASWSFKDLTFRLLAYECILFSLMAVCQTVAVHFIEASLPFCSSSFTVPRFRLTQSRILLLAITLGEIRHSGPALCIWNNQTISRRVLAPFWQNTDGKETLICMQDWTFSRHSQAAPQSSIRVIPLKIHQGANAWQI